VLAGVGNVFKSEILFAERLHPLTPIGGLDEAALRLLVERAARLLAANRERPRRLTTGVDRPGRRLWVYQRAGEPCRRCAASIAAAWLGTPPRITFWCPSCQPEPART